MIEFFKPWRLRIGCLMLLLAIGFAIFWVRSTRLEDEIELACPPFSVSLYSYESSLIIVLLYGHQNPYHRYLLIWDSQIPFFRPSVKSRLAEEWGFFSDDPTGRFRFGDEMCIGVISPFWWITIPLTLVSAYLLLSKPRMEKTKRHRTITSNGA